MTNNHPAFTRRTALAAGALLPAAAALTSPASATGTKARREGGITTPADLVADTPAGRVKGYRSTGISIFKGIPYGAPTGGKNRFLPPRPAAPWNGTRLALSAGAVCPQQKETRGPSPSSFVMQRSFSVQDEDCLSLNIWTPALDGKKRPVLFWIHGGNFSTGSSIELAAYDGEAMARRGDVVVVSINHRLNLLGYLDLQSVGAPDDFASSANVGMLDIVMALQWVRETIANFGGDPGNVTIFGQSGGGLKVTTLCAMPLAQGLFHKAIVQSGSESRIFDRAMTEPLARALLDECGLSPAQAHKLQDIPIASLMAAGAKVIGPWFGKFTGNVWQLVGWAPVVDGSIIPAHPYEAASRPLSAPIPLMVGTVRHEFIATMGNADAIAMTMEDMRKALAVGYNNPGVLAAAFAKAYPDEKPVGLMAMISAASFNRYNAITQAQDKAAGGGAPAWLYRFDWVTPMLDGIPHAYHCAELPLVFNSIEKVPEAAGTSARTRAMAERMCDTWVAFARTGNPNHSGIPHWPAVQPGTAPTMAFNDQSTVENYTDRELVALVRENRKWA